MEPGLPLSPALLLRGHANSPTSPRAAPTVGSLRCSLRKIHDEFTQVLQEGTVLGSARRDKVGSWLLESPGESSRVDLSQQQGSYSRPGWLRRCPCLSLLGANTAPVCHHAALKAAAPGVHVTSLDVQIPVQARADSHTSSAGPLLPHTLSSLGCGPLAGDK